MNMDKLYKRFQANKEAAINEYQAPSQETIRSAPDKRGSGSNSLNNVNGLFLVLWKGKFAFVVNAKGEIAATVLFDDEGKLAPSSRKSAPVW